MSAYGLKKDYHDETKLARKQVRLNEGKNYYPNDKEGIVDEWSAMSKTM